MLELVGSKLGIAKLSPSHAGAIGTGKGLVAVGAPGIYGSGEICVGHSTTPSRPSGRWVSAGA